jgi:hypothetical protein
LAGCRKISFGGSGILRNTTDERFCKKAAIFLAAFAAISLFATDATLAVPAAESNKAVVSRVPRAAGNHYVKGKILIHASPEVVWKTVHEERQKDPDLAYSKILEKSDANNCVLEQKFVFLPFIGTAVCKMSNVEVPLKSIEYKLLDSNHFRAMEGSWVLTPHPSGKSTYLELSSYLELGFGAPRRLLDNISSRKLAKRLENVKTLAEHNQARIAQQPRTGISR